MDLQPKGDVVIDCHIFEQRIILKHESDAALAARHIVDNSSINDNVSGVLMLQPCNHTQNGGFSAAGRPQQRYQPPLLNCQINVIRRRISIVGFYDVFQFHIHQMSPRLSPLYSITARTTRMIMAITTKIEDTAKAGA